MPGLGRVINCFPRCDGACFGTGQGARREVWSFQTNDEQRRAVPKQARPCGWGRLGCAGNGAMRRCSLWQGNDHCLQAAPCRTRPGLAPFPAATQPGKQLMTRPNGPQDG
ncbi:hypothetical protein AvCA_40180 [Azotobacter vinelandii CA]|uniref:Uncharacterized protein n=2 Tax=Azotobacter vinelandii TaxID=354 RepID=C1DE46_AZOVD|nr:hypothetical protein Avin_40180 [Azotobacter vinelandii DJ]AGK16089.1 hypothetical protein AvCA_40180 [Azotobacter vinelandii CA]AGK21740.1 hypothetical protein AvCA6_40180 [Azotobacter vinelandii CA6]